MSALYLALLLPVLVAASVAMAAALLTLHALRKLHTEIAGLRAQALPTDHAVPAPRTGQVAEAALLCHGPEVRKAEIRKAVAEALAEERERELAEIRAFWDTQEAHDAVEALMSDPGDAGDQDGQDAVSDDRKGVPAPLSADARDLFEERFAEALRQALDDFDLAPEDNQAATGEERHTDRTDNPAVPADPGAAPWTAAGQGPGIRQHPSHPGFRPSPATASRAATLGRLEALSKNGVPLREVRPGPLGTLDVYAFDDGTTLCVTPADRSATERLTTALRSGESPLLLGGSTVAGAFTLTFGAGDATVYVVADRVVAWL